MAHRSNRRSWAGSFISAPRILNSSLIFIGNPTSTFKVPGYGAYPIAVRNTSGNLFIRRLKSPQPETILPLRLIHFGIFSVSCPSFLVGQPRITSGRFEDPPSGGFFFQGMLLYVRYKGVFYLLYGYTFPDVLIGIHESSNVTRAMA